MVLSLFNLLIAYAILVGMTWKQDNIFGHIILALYSMLCATVSLTLFGSEISPEGIVSGVPGMWIIAVFFIFGSLISITRIYRAKKG